jgi:hypothetical protein
LDNALTWPGQVKDAGLGFDEVGGGTFGVVVKSKRLY